MRLKDRDDAARVLRSGRFEGGLYFDRMMSVVVDDANPGFAPLEFEASRYPAKTCDRFCCDFERNTDFKHDRDCGEGVFDVVGARERKVHRADLRAFVLDGKLHSQLTRLNVLCAKVRVAVDAVTHHPTFDLVGERANPCMVCAKNCRTPERQVVRETEERVFEGAHPAVVVEVVGVDVRHDGNARVEMEERAVALVGFGNQPVALANHGTARSPCAALYPAANECGGVVSRFDEDMRHKRSRSRLAVSSRYRDALFSAHGFGEHFRARDDGDPSAPGFDDLRISSVDRGRANDDVGFLQMGRVVSDADLNARRAQVVDHATGGEVRTTDFESTVVHQFCDPAHADATDSNKVQMFDPVLQGDAAPAATWLGPASTSSMHFMTMSWAALG